MKHIHIPKKTYSKMSSLINQPQFNSHYITAILGEVLLENRAWGAISDQLHLIRIWMLKQNIPLDLYSKCRFPFVLIIGTMIIRRSFIKDYLRIYLLYPTNNQMNI